MAVASLVPGVCVLIYVAFYMNPFKWSRRKIIHAGVAYLRYRWELFSYPVQAKYRIQDAYVKAKGLPIRMNSPESWMTLVSSSDQIRDICNATNEELSLHAAAKEILRPEHTMNGFNWHDQRGVEGIGFVRTLRTLLTSHLPQLTPGTRVIIDRVFANEVGEERTVNALQLCKKVVTKLSAYAFFGLDHVENHEFIEAAYYYNEDVLYGSEILRMLPAFLVPLIGSIFPLFLKRQRKFYEGLVAIIEDRMSDIGSSREHNDVIQWIIDTSPKSSPWSPGRMAFEVMAIWFGSVQGLATTLTFSIYTLCEHQEYIKPLRQEIKSSISDQFFIKGEGLPLMDSFLKECMRWTPVETVTARRCALKDFTFSDGTRVAKGEWVGIPVGPMLHDSVNYPDPDTFQGFRYVNSRGIDPRIAVQPEGPSKLTDISNIWHVWGIGKLTCPGRFFVSYVMKHVMYHILECYDFELVRKDRRNTVAWRTLTLPAPGVKINFKARIDQSSLADE